MSRLFAFVNNKTGNIESIIDIGLLATNYNHGKVQGDHTMLDVTDRDDIDVLITERAYKDGQWIIRPPQPNIYYDWDNSIESWVLSDRFLFEVRAERNKRLLGSDWTQIPNSPLNEEQKGAWATYRQQLRDITEQLTGITDIEQVPWPTEPV